MFIANIYQDYNNDEVSFLPVVYKDFIDGSILHLYADKDTKEEIWWPAEVVDVDTDVEKFDEKNPEFFVLYEDPETSETDCNEPEYFLCPLIHDYLNGWVQFVDYQNI